MNDRERILQLYEKGHKISHIARIIGVTHSCVSKIMTRYRRTGSMYPRSYSAGNLAAQQKSLDLAESSSDCSTTSMSEDWSTTYLAMKNASEERQELCSEGKWENARRGGRVADQTAVMVDNKARRDKSSSYSIERSIEQHKYVSYIMRSYLDELSVPDGQYTPSSDDRRI
ncbi:hypothetical protein OESDEN_10924 [Oesophagostomum dentatum]|uniref:Paired domain-containing protein n=1 Tax=Oesophagostomum dentatum TaxID=61180 RepID=A0A0B1T1I1_OESDE|nr:hypothetical protein OESDEN_10924 [Oesophagostomum dentatum]